MPPCRGLRNCRAAANPPQLLARGDASSTSLAANPVFATTATAFTIADYIGFPVGTVAPTSFPLWPVGMLPLSLLVSL